MNQALRRHHGTEVLALGMLSAAVLLAFVPLVERYNWLLNPMWISSIAMALIAVTVGALQLSGMKASRIDPTGKRSAKVGMVLGSVTALGWVVVVAVAGYFTTKYFANAEFTVTPAAGTHRSITTFHAGEVDSKHDEVLGPDGNWQFDGHFVRYSQSSSRTKLEEGNYQGGKREGAWIFRIEDGSIDAARTGVYKDDVKISELDTDSH